MTEMTPQEDRERIRRLWWKEIVRLEPDLANDEAKSSIESVLTRHERTKAIVRKRLNHTDVAEMKMRVEKLRRDIQPYLPHERAMASFHLKVRQSIANLDLVAEYLEGIGELLKKNTKRGRKREGLVQELVAELGKIRQHFTGRGLGWDGATERYIHACCAGLGEEDKTITNAKTYVLKHPAEFGMERVEVGDANPERTVP